MIIWLSSFPRSGNTLLRTILRQTMGLGSYSDEVVRPIVGLTAAAKDRFGHLSYDEPWEKFYECASKSHERFLIKTHRPPIDDQPAIYVVRDGRRALESYREYHHQFLENDALGLLALIAGCDFYGGWSEHYRNWVTESRKTLLLRYEELVNISSDGIRSLAEFIGHKGELSGWNNPFVSLHRENPDFFRVGRAAWDEKAGWSDLTNGIFFLLHGELMRILGYADAEGVQAATDAVPPEARELIQVIKFLLAKSKELEQVCRERMTVIEKLDEEVRRLAGYTMSGRIS